MGTWKPKFQRNLPPHSLGFIFQPWRCKQYDPPKCP